MRHAAALAALLLPLAAQAADTVAWLMPDFPPASIPVKGQPTDGIADKVLQYITAHWPEAEHRYIYANPKRTWLLIESGEKACFAAALRTPERDRIAYFSNTNLVPPTELIVPADTIAKLPLNGAGEVDLPRLLAERKLRGLLVDRRSYGPAVDNMLDRRPADARLERSVVGDYGRNVLKVVAHGRADYTIDYDIALTYAKQTQGGLDKLRTVPIAGNNKAMLVGIACPRNAWGKAMVQRIDRIIGTREGAAEMMRAQASWHTAATRQRYAPQLQEFQRQRARPSGG